MVISNVRAVVTHDRVEPGARLERELEISRQIKRGLGLEIERIEAAFLRAATAIRFMFATELEIKLEEPFLEKIGVIQEHRRLVAGVEEGRILGEGIPERSLRIR